MNPTISVAVTGYPVSLQEAHEHLKQYDDFEDDLIELQIAAATEYVETAADTSLMKREYSYFLECFPSTIPLRLGPILNIVSIEYYDSDNAKQTLSTAAYTFNQVTQEVETVSGESWPATYSRWDSVTVKYDAGYTNKAAVPFAAKAAILLLVADMYEHREKQVLGLNVNKNRTFEDLVNSFKMFRV